VPELVTAKKLTTSRDWKASWALKVKAIRPEHYAEPYSIEGLHLARAQLRPAYKDAFLHMRLWRILI
jgi:hypothetical protein